jgi:hypothetical protein
VLLQKVQTNEPLDSLGRPELSAGQPWAYWGNVGTRGSTRCYPVPSRVCAEGDDARTTFSNNGLYDLFINSLHLVLHPFGLKAR